MGSTLTGIPLYKLKGYVELELIQVPLQNGEHLPVMRMAKWQADLAAPVTQLEKQDSG
jgi:hypothetical protein